MAFSLTALLIAGLAAHSKRKHSNNNSRSYKTDPHCSQLSSRLLFLHQTVHSTHLPLAPLAAIVLTATSPATPSHQATKRPVHSKTPAAVQQQPSIQLQPQPHRPNMPQPAQPTTIPSRSAQSVSKADPTRANASRSNASPSPPPAAAPEPRLRLRLQKNNNNNRNVPRRRCRTYQASQSRQHLVLSYQFALLRKKNAHRGPARSRLEKSALR